MSTTHSPAARPAVPPVTVDLIIDALKRSAHGVTGESAPPGRRRPAADDLIAGYRLVRSLGRGGMAEVFEAVQVRLRRRVALKLLVMDEERRALAPRFLREARAMMQVRHLNLVAIHDAGQVDHLHYLAMELMAGGDLAARVERQGPIALEQALRWAIGCCDGLDALHHAGLVHRDIKPGNLFLDGGGEVKIGDFGLARQVSGADRMTITGTAWGTPSYMAPEQIVGARDVDARADLYAVGATLYTLLTGREPFSGETAYLATFKAMTEPFPDPRTCRPEVPAAVAAIIRMATEHARERRYSSARLLREDLERALRQERPLHAGMHAVQPATLPHRAITVPPLPATSVHPRAPRRSRRGGAVLMGIALLALGWWWSTTPPAPDPGLPVWATAGGRDLFGRWAEITIGDVTTRLRYRPPDTFLMGSPPDEPGRSPDEARRAVTLTTGFWIQDSECDQAFFTAVMGSNPSRHRGARLPVENLDWYEAQAFCQELARRGVPARLPSEAEWEYACRAGSDDAFGGLEPDEVAWTAPADLLAAWREGEDAAHAWCEVRQDDLRLRAHPIAARRPNAAGLFDVHGNVLEWCGDGGDATDATGAAFPADGEPVVARGGSWFHPPTQARSAARSVLAPESRSDHLGFRFVIPQPAR